METKVTTSIKEAADVIRGGGLVAFPTETVYGLGANTFDEAAVSKIFVAKMRPADNPLIIHIFDVAELSELVKEVNSTARSLIEKYFPGPLTIVLEASDKVPDNVTAGLRTVAVRMPGNPVARDFLKECGVPVAAPSANLSGRPSPTTWEAVLEDMNGRIECILRGDPTEIGLESTVIDCTGEVPILLRPGAISLDQLRYTYPAMRAFELSENITSRSPGMRHTHYSPRAKVMLVGSDITGDLVPGQAYIGIDIPEQVFRLARICNDVAGYGRELFEFFRECDRAGIEIIYCQTVPEEGFGRALMDRLRRAAE
ncbi:L-threonylcarbamoyladenylate synthase [Leptolyngbya sp. 7M]|uniref:L-threonylcarbamoyladenylate synthase n=1 Tax=Leptolyngbya sp. 7M TaxID=2812896 RepID=UPI001B8BCDEB|nr:L-threonylcarbamoyladenylate synthase [Leptolyngbya sp. 7M]QYO66903.1 threonylcarbamoyl-AMP synthase [Leptolyngbya sp. 7M]